MICIPPQGLLFLRISCPSLQNLSNIAPSTIDTSSIINTFVFVHLPEAFLFNLSFLRSISGVSVASPTPPNECKVTPPMLQAAIPVEAVTATASGFLAYLFRKPWIISRSRTDLPVPALPVKNTFFCCCITRVKTFCCSSLRVTRCLMLRAELVDLG